MGFYVPDSLGQSYVANKKNEQGEYKYESMTDEALIQRQSAMQELNKQYSQTIDNAYASYLAANNNLNAAAMGQGYKELYKQMQQNELTSNIDQISAQAAQARAQIDANTTEQLAAIQKAQSTEVSNFDRLARDFDSYLGYVRNLTKTDGENTTSWLSDMTGYTEDEVKDLTVDQLYDILSQTGQDDYKDAQGNAGLSFLQWHRDQLKDTANDNAYRQWVYDYNDSGKTGYQEFLDAPKSTKQINREEVLKEKDEKYAKEYDSILTEYANKHIEAFETKGIEGLKKKKALAEWYNSIKDKYPLSEDEINNRLSEISNGKYGTQAKERRLKEELANEARKEEERLKNMEIMETGTKWSKGNKISNDTWLVNNTRYTYVDTLLSKNIPTRLKNIGVNKDGDFVEYKGKYYIYERGEFKEVRRV